MQTNLKKKRQLGRDKREFEPLASALEWQKSSNNWQWRPTHWEHFTANIIIKIKQANNWIMP